MTALLTAPHDVRRSKAACARYVETNDSLSRYLATDAGKVEAGMYALGMVCERSIKRDPEYREAR